eukprot:1175944-Prorocentrum_minimum.AAC.4
MPCLLHDVVLVLHPDGPTPPKIGYQRLLVAKDSQGSGRMRSATYSHRPFSTASSAADIEDGAVSGAGPSANDASAKPAVALDALLVRLPRFRALRRRAVAPTSARGFRVLGL